MPNYEKMYFKLFNAITDALQLLEEKDIGRAAFILAKAQYDAEEEYISAEQKFVPKSVILSVSEGSQK